MSSRSGTPPALAERDRGVCGSGAEWGVGSRLMPGVLEYDPDEKYEAWEFTTESGAMVLCMGGGALAIWSEHQQAQTRPRPWGRSR